MSNKIRNNKDRQDKESLSNSVKNNYNDVIYNEEDSMIFNTFGEYMKGRLDLEEVMNDPSLKIIESNVKKLIIDNSLNRVLNEENESYIRDAFKELKEEKDLLKEIDEIKKEIRTNDINEEAAGWVNEWQKNRVAKSDRNHDTDEKTDFIRNSLASEINMLARDTQHIEKTGLNRSLIFRYISVSAAAVIALFFLIRVLLPSSDPEELFKTYYTPFNYVSSATRDASVNELEDFSRAVEKYKTGNFLSASLEFSNIIKRDTSFITPRFLMGIIDLELGEYEKAIDLLNSIKYPSNKYYKETIWYLGLVYLKTGEKTSAANCFEILAKAPGFYNDRAKKILRRLR
jgi:hypothetical protein